MPKLVYTPEYWQSAFALVDRNIHQCEYCHGAHSLRRGGMYCFVRVIDIGAKPGDPRNLVLACTKCRPNRQKVRVTRKQILDKIAELPFPAQPGVTGAHG